MGVAGCRQCGCFISLSIIEGGNPVAQQTGWQTRYTKCQRCEDFYCASCVEKNGGKCPSCDVDVAVYTYREEMARKGYAVPDFELTSEVREQTSIATENLLEAVRNGDLARLREFVSRSPGLARAEGKEGYTALHLAACAGEWPMAACLLDAGADINARDRAEGRTPLHCATVRGHPDMIASLIERGARVNARNQARGTPLFMPAWHGHVAALRVLLEYGADANAQDEELQTPLHWAAFQGHVEVVALLVQCGARTGSRNAKGMIPLHLAARQGHADVIRELVAKNTADINMSVGGYTPLRLATEASHTNAAEVLRSYGAR